MRMARSLTDRVFGGVCGGVSAYLGINPWWGRALLAVLTVLSGGVAALLYLILWWTLPPDLTPDEPYAGRDIGALLLVSAVIILTGVIITARGMGVLSGPGGQDIFWPALVMIVGAALLVRQIRG
jgi:phage shock protein PspC (stress-responsive transcriptional regulator)